MECTCNIDSSRSNVYKNPIQIIKTAKYIIDCVECGSDIKIGSKYEYYEGKFSHITCLDCLSLRDNFFDSWTFGNIWEDFENHMNECDWQVPESCLSKCTVFTRNKICGKIENFWDELQMFDYEKVCYDRLLPKIKFMVNEVNSFVIAHRKQQIITCPETCWCWEAEKLVYSFQLWEDKSQIIKMET